MNPEALDKRVTLQVLAETRNALNESVGGWVNFITTGDGKVWARIRDISGRQYLAAGAAQNSATTEIIIRRRAGVVPAMRVLHGSDIYDISAALQFGKDYLNLMTVRGANNG